MLIPHSEAASEFSASKSLFIVNSWHAWVVFQHVKWAQRPDTLVKSVRAKQDPYRAAVNKKWGMWGLTSRVLSHQKLQAVPWVFLSRPVNGNYIDSKLHWLDLIRFYPWRNCFQLKMNITACIFQLWTHILCLTGWAIFEICLVYLSIYKTCLII